MEMPLYVSLPLVPFEKWGIDYVGEVHPNFSNQWSGGACQRDSSEHPTQYSYRLEERLGYQVERGIVGLLKYIQSDNTCYSIFSYFWD